MGRESIASTAGTALTRRVSAQLAHTPAFSYTRNSFSETTASFFFRTNIAFPLFSTDAPFARALKVLFGKMLNAVYPNIGPHRDAASGMLVYLLR